MVGDVSDEGCMEKCLIDTDFSCCGCGREREPTLRAPRPIPPQPDPTPRARDQQLGPTLKTARRLSRHAVTSFWISCKQVPESSWLSALERGFAPPACAQLHRHSSPKLAPGASVRTPPSRVIPLPRVSPVPFKPHRVTNRAGYHTLPAVSIPIARRQLCLHPVPQVVRPARHRAQRRTQEIPFWRRVA